VLFRGQWIEPCWWRPCIYNMPHEPSLTPETVRRELARVVNDGL
jgi:hypothetical protein